MTNRKQSAQRVGIGFLAVAGLVWAGPLTLAEDSPQRAEPVDSVRVVLARQNSDVLRVYLRDARRVYVNGKQVPLELLTTIADTAGVERAVVVAEPIVTPERADEVANRIREAGVDDVEVSEPPPRPVEGIDAKIKLILHRQKGDRLKVYVNDRGAYVNGKSVSLDTLTTLAERSGLAGATITAEPYVTEEYVAHVEGLLRKADFEDVDRLAPKR